MFLIPTCQISVTAESPGCGLSENDGGMQDCSLVTFEETISSVSSLSSRNSKSSAYNSTKLS